MDCLQYFWYRLDRKLKFFLKVLQYFYIRLLCIHGLTAVLLVQSRGEMAVLPEVTAVLLHHSAIDTLTD